MLIDAYQIPFGSVDIKGLTMGSLEIKPDINTPSGLRVSGLHEGDYTSRLITASDTLRKYGINTEWTIPASEVNEVELEGERMSMNEWKTLVWDKFHKGKLDPNITEEQMYELLKTRFDATIRLTQTSRRVSDISHIKDKEAAILSLICEIS